MRERALQDRRAASEAMPEASPEGQRSAGKRLLWFAGLWAASVAAVGAVALLIRWALLF